MDYNPPQQPHFNFIAFVKGPLSKYSDILKASAHVFAGTQLSPQSSLGGSVTKNPPANAGDARELGSIPEWGKSLEKEMSTHSSILAWEMAQTEEPGGLQSRGSQRVRHGLVIKQRLLSPQCCP